MGCTLSKPKVGEKELITIDQLEKELFKFNNNIRGYWRRKKTFCLRRVKPKSGHNNAPSSHGPVAPEEKRPGLASEQTKARVPFDEKSRKTEEENDVRTSASSRTAARTSKEIKQDGAPRLLRSVYSKTEPIRIQGWFSLQSIPPATKSLPLQRRQLSDPSQVTAADVVVLNSKSVQHIQDECSVLRQLHVNNLYNPNKHYDIVKEIGEGSYGKVHLAKHKEIQDKEYAIKTIPLEDSDKKNLVVELEVLRKCSHKNILALTDSYLADECLFIITEYVPGISVFTLSTETDGLTEKVVASVMKESLQGLAYLHKQGYIHCDVKSENILIGIDKQVKIADFGLAVRMNEERPRGFRGTKLFCSPEMANRLPYGKEIDIWGMGIVAIEMFQGYPPLDEADGLQSFISLSQSGYNAMNEEAASKASQVFNDFLYKGALKYHPADRLTADELLDHPFMSRGDDGHSLPLVVDWVMQKLLKEQMPWQEEQEDELFCWMKSYSTSE